MKDEIYENIREIAASILGVEPEALRADSSPETLEAWDSVQHLNLILALEERLNLTFEPEEIDGMKNLGAIVATVERKQAAAI